MSDLILPSVELPGRNPPKLKDLKISRLEERCLRGWGFVEPFTGAVAEVTDEQETFYWLGKFTVRDEAPLILAPVPQGSVLEYTPWYFGVIERGVLAAADDPLDVLFDTAINCTSASDYTGKHKVPIERLNDLIPSGYADTER